MAEELARIKQSMGSDFDPLLVVYGGAGPAHICDIASAAGLKKIVMTPFSAVFSAFSSLGMDVGHLYYRRVGLPLDDAGWARPCPRRWPPWSKRPGATCAGRASRPRRSPSPWSF